ncbi:virulence factor [Lysinibacillus sp. 2017]|uniref:virulence factor n=1 Tax=unclassified Lysinibacillus TaxID=2636778 RepID=UPI000D52A362|nr:MULTISPECIES: virulence factor [unclassified Lysinibacillus]AWE07089.1 virulence factor [Lysinibacillus sp. 2017]TGN36991.1 virulence factor [Lysinibacillus sp. S2017]
MKILSIEPTPSPNSMKIIIDQDLPFGKSFNYTKDNISEASTELQAIFGVEGVKGIYHVSNFLAVERNSKYAWENILAEIRTSLGGEASEIEQQGVNEHYGEVNVHVQMYKAIPLQIKAFDGEGEVRLSAGDRFTLAFKRLQFKVAEGNYILERKWVDFGVRYGDKTQVAEEVVKEVDALYPQDRVEQIVEGVNEKVATIADERKEVTLEEYMQAADWQQRFQLLDKLPDPELKDIPLLEKALEDEQMSIRRLATVYLGMIEDNAVVSALTKALNDKSSAVRRTAGDCMSDLGLTAFEPAMISALADKNKLVRWRAAMYLYEVGTDAAIQALKVACEDKEFEVKLQAKMALARIEDGEEAKGSVWKQMTESRK